VTGIFNRRSFSKFKHRWQIQFSLFPIANHALLLLAAKPGKREYVTMIFCFFRQRISVSNKGLQPLVMLSASSLKGFIVSSAGGGVTK
jgi:hypothetical protein